MRTSVVSGMTLIHSQRPRVSSPLPVTNALPDRAKPATLVHDRTKGVHLILGERRSIFGVARDCCIVAASIHDGQEPNTPPASFTSLLSFARELSKRGRHQLPIAGRLMLG